MGHSKPKVSKSMYEGWDEEEDPLTGYVSPVPR